MYIHLNIAVRSGLYYIEYIMKEKKIQDCENE